MSVFCPIVQTEQKQKPRRRIVGLCSTPTATMSGPTCNTSAQTSNVSVETAPTTDRPTQQNVSRWRCHAVDGPVAAPAALCSVLSLPSQIELCIHSFHICVSDKNQQQHLQTSVLSNMMHAPDLPIWGPQNWECPTDPARVKQLLSQMRGSKTEVMRHVNSFPFEQINSIACPTS